MFRLLVIFCAILKTFSASADGFPIDNEGNILAPYLSIKLEPHQKNGLRINGMILLTAEQLATINVPGFPSKLEIMSPHRQGCTCGIAAFGIWFTPDSIAILHRILERDFKSRDMIEMLTEDNDEPDWLFNNAVFISMEGELYFRGQTQSVINLSKNPKVKKDRHVLLYMPPKKGNPQWNKIQAAINEIDSVLPGGYDLIFV